VFVVNTEVCSKIERREREIALMLDSMNREATVDDVISPERQRQTMSSPASATVGQQHSASPGQSGDKRGNIFQRLLRALRRRLARRQQQQQQDTTTDQQRQRQQAMERRQRTL